MRVPRSKLAATALAAAGLVGLAAAPAIAGPGDTTTTFTLSGNGLSVSVPGSANLSTSGATAIGGSSSLAGSLGTVTVNDNRGALAATWTASVASTDFTTGSGSANEKVTKANVAYTPGVVSNTGVGVGVGTPAANLSSSASVVTAAGVTGAQQSSWNPTVTVTISSDKVAGTYSGTLTPSVA